MKRGLLIATMLVGIVGAAFAQHDDLYFVPKKKKVKTEVSAESKVEAQESGQDKQGNETAAFMDEDAYNRRTLYLTEQGDAVSEFAMNDEGFVLITEEGDTIWLNTDTLRLARAIDEGWVNGFEGSDSDYEYAMRIVRFRSPRYAIPVSSPLYWDVVYGGALWPSWDWNIYDDGMYAYVFPTSSNWYYWDYMMGYPYYGGSWGGYYGHHWYNWGYHSHMWWSPWQHHHYHGYHPGWPHGPHLGHYPGIGIGKPNWSSLPSVKRNDRHATVASTRRGVQDAGINRGAASVTRQGTSVTRQSNGGSTRSSSVRVVSGRTGSTQSTGVTRSTSGRSVNDEIVRRSGTSSSVGRGVSTGGGSRSEYTRQSTSRSSSGSSYNRPSSTRSSSSSSVSRSSSSSSGSSRSSYSSGSTSGSSSSRSSYSGGSSSYSPSRSSSYSGSSYGGGSRSGGSGSYGGGSSRSGSSSGTRR